MVSCAMAQGADAPDTATPVVVEALEVLDAVDEVVADPEVSPAGAEELTAGDVGDFSDAGDEETTGVLDTAAGLKPCDERATGVWPGSLKANTVSTASAAATSPSASKSRRRQ